MNVKLAADFGVVTLDRALWHKDARPKLIGGRASKYDLHSFRGNGHAAAERDAAGRRLQSGL
jgi:hypothetical protein